MAMDPVVVLERARVLHCEQCPRVFLDRALRKAHVAKHSNDFKTLAPVVLLERVSQFWCATCSTSFPTHRDLQLHRVGHVKSNIIKAKINSDSDTKPHACESCDARFVLLSTLRLHRVLHRPYPHVCRCGVGYRRAQDYRGHLALVHGESAPSVPRERARRTAAPRDTAAPAPAPALAAEWEPLTSYRPKPVVVSRTDRAKQRQRPTGTPKIKPILSLAVKRGPMLRVDLVSAPKKSKSKKSKGGNEHSESNRVKDAEGTAKGKRRFICEVCNKAIASKKGLQRHLRTQHTAGEKPFECEICGKRFTESGAMKLHIVRHHGPPVVFICDVCNKAIASKKGLEMHLRVHTGEKPFECEICGRRFNQPGSKKLHIVRHHGGARDFPCGVCHKALSSKVNLQVHLRTHTGERPYQCAVCHKDFSDPSAYKRHMRTHTGVKPYACAECGMRFSDASAHIQHRLRRHRPRVRAHECPECHKRFLHKHDVKVHMGGVHGGRAHSCEHCGARFTLKMYLAHHMERMHMARRRRCRRCGAEMLSLLGEYVRHVDSHGKKKRRRRKLTITSDDNEM